MLMIKDNWCCADYHFYLHLRAVKRHKSHFILCDEKICGIHMTNHTTCFGNHDFLISVHTETKRGKTEIFT